MDNAALLETCLQVTGKFENGTPAYDAMTGNGDGEGISIGLLQWNAGQGTLQKLVASIGAAMGWTRAKSFFVSDIQQFSTLNPAAAITFAKQHYLDDTNQSRLAPAAATAWRNFLNTPESIAAQQVYAESTTLAQAQRYAQKYVANYADRSRVVAFFFDLVNQEGSMSTVAVADGNGDEAIAFAKTQDAACAALWAEAAASDPLTPLLLYYGYARAKLGREQYIWDSLSRRGTIAARKGIVHQGHVDFTSLLD